jgi:hypothetical protein
MSPFVHVAWASGVTPGSIDVRVAAVRDSITSVSGYWGEADPLYWTGGADYNTALWFDNCAIPVGATITSARLTVYTANNMSGATANDEVTIAAEDVDDPAILSSQSDHDTRKSNTTTATVDWYVWEANGPLTDADQPVQSPDLSTIVQEIVDRAGWASGNAIMFFAQDKGTFDNSLGMRSYYNGVSASYPRLEVSWT